MSPIRALLLLALLAPAAAQARVGEFEIMDSNDDGRVSSSEHEVSVRAAYDRLDGNADDKLTQAEIDAAGKEVVRHVYAGGVLPGATAEPDGLISQGEYASAAAAKFQKMDRNNSGELSFEEYWAGR